MKKLSKTIFILIALVLVVGIIVLITRHKSGNKEETALIPDKAIEPCDSAATPQYCEILTQALQLGKMPWNKYTYYQIQATINGYVQNKFISEKQGLDLKNLLDSKYLSVLDDTIRKYCVSAARLDEEKLHQFDQELASTPSDQEMQQTKNNLRRLVANFRQALLLPSQIKNYVTTGPYDTNALRLRYARIAAFKKMDIIGKNYWILASLRSCTDYLAAYTDMDSTVNLCVNRVDLLRGKTIQDINRMCSVKGLVNTYYPAILAKLEPQ